MTPINPDTRPLPVPVKPGGLIDIMKTSGRKFAWAYAALFGICALNALGTLKDERFEMCFGALVATLMAANYGEHKEKQKTATAEAKVTEAA